MPTRRRRWAHSARRGSPAGLLGNIRTKRTPPHPAVQPQHQHEHKSALRSLRSRGARSWAHGHTVRDQSGRTQNARRMFTHSAHVTHIVDYTFSSIDADDFSRAPPVKVIQKALESRRKDYLKTTTPRPPQAAAPKPPQQQQLLPQHALTTLLLFTSSCPRWLGTFRSRTPSNRAREPPQAPARPGPAAAGSA